MLNDEERRLAHEAFDRFLAERDEAMVQELIDALNMLPTAEEPTALRPGTTPNFGLTGGELGC